MNPALSHIFNHFFGTPNDFIRVNKIDFEKKFKPITNIFEGLPYNNRLSILQSKLESSRYSSIHSFIYPIVDSHEIYVRISTLQAIRDYCLTLLDTLPESQENALREFLIYSEPQAKSQNNQHLAGLTFMATTLNPL